MTKYVCNPQDFAGNFLEEAEPKYVPRNRQKKNGTVSLSKRRQVKLQCLHCKQPFIMDLSNALRTKQRYCSGNCHKRSIEVFAGGNEQHPLYSRWLAMKQRVLNTTSISYHNYGGRGITIQSEFKDDFEYYVKYVMSLPNAPTKFPTTLQLDRINNDGNYEEGNLRWVSVNINRNNQRKKTSKYGKYTGINWSITNNAWLARISHLGKTINLGYFNDEETALQARNQYIIDNNLPHKIQSII